MRILLSSLLGTLLLSALAFGADAPNATIQYKLDFPAANPSHYEITVTSDGKDIYSSNGALRDGDTTDPEPFEFTVSEKTRRELFDLAKRAKYFTGKVDSGRAGLANMGAKTLIYKDASHNMSA